MSEASNKKPVIACIRPGAIGDMIMTLHCTKALREKYPDHELVYYTNGEMKKELGDFILKVGFDRVDSDYINPKGDKVFRMVGYPPHIAWTNSSEPMKKHLVTYFGEEMGLNVTLDDLSLPKPDVPVDAKYITIQSKAKWSPYKNWPIDRWQAVCDYFLSQGVSVYQVGGPNDPKIKNLSGYPMEKGFNESVSYIANASMHLGIDSWCNHATNIIWQGKGRTRAVILWGSSQPSAAGYPHNRNVQLGISCQPCFKEDPKLSMVHRGICTNPPGQTYDSPQHECMIGLTVEKVLEEAKSLWSEVT